MLLFRFGFLFGPFCFLGGFLFFSHLFTDAGLLLLFFLLGLFLFIDKLELCDPIL